MNALLARCPRARSPAYLACFSIPEHTTEMASLVRTPMASHADFGSARQLVTRRIEHPVREEQKVCPKCGGHNFTKLADGKMTEIYELVPAHMAAAYKKANPEMKGGIRHPKPSRWRSTAWPS